jgi:hypothetical protein
LQKSLTFFLYYGIITPVDPLWLLKLWTSPVTSQSAVAVSFQDWDAVCGVEGESYVLAPSSYGTYTKVSVQPTLFHQGKTFGRVSHSSLATPCGAAAQKPAVWGGKYLIEVSISRLKFSADGHIRSI